MRGLDCFRRALRRPYYLRLPSGASVDHPVLFFARWSRLLPAPSSSVSVLFLQYASVYRDAPISELKSRVSDGAYAGLLTTPATRTFLQELENDLRAVSRPQCRIVFYDTFPAGYLLDRGKGLTNATWLLDVRKGYRAEYQRVLIDYYARRMTIPDIVVRVSRVPLGNTAGIERSYWKSEPRELLFTEPRYVVVCRRE